MSHRSQLLLSALLAAAGPIGCGGAPDGPPMHEMPGAPPKTPAAPEKASASARPLSEAEPMRFDSGMTTRQRLVVRDGATWANVWSQIASNRLPIPAVPAIDFASDVVIVAAMGTRSSGGYSITIDDVSIVAEDARISITEKSPGANCWVAASLTAPVAVVVVPRFAGKATFLERTSETACK